MPDPLIVFAVILVTEAGIVASHVHRNNPTWTDVHLFHHIAGLARFGRWYRFWTDRAVQTEGHNIDLFHVASFCSHFPMALLVLYWVGSWWLAIAAAIGSQVVWRLVIAHSGIGWESFWLRLWRRIAR